MSNTPLLRELVIVDDSENLISTTMPKSARCHGSMYVCRRLGRG